MKKIILSCIISTTIISGCTKDLLDQPVTDQISTNQFWQNKDEALQGLNGAYAAFRDDFKNEWKYDDYSELIQCGDYPDAGWSNLYKLINRCNVVITNINKMLQNYSSDSSTLSTLKRCIGEAKFLRGLAYFRLIDLYGDVPYISNVISNDEAYRVSRTPKAQICDSILADFQSAIEVCPNSYSSSEYGRVTKPAAFAFRGKFKLFWACWMKNEGKSTEAQKYYSDAASDFKEVMSYKYGFDLFQGGDPGTATDPNYRKLFLFQNERCPEVILSVQNIGGQKLGLGEDFQFQFGNRSTINSQSRCMPLMELVNRYQLISSGDYAPTFVPNSSSAILNGACNPNSYSDRDYRLKSTIVWDGETMTAISNDGMTLNGTVTFKYGTNGVAGYVRYDQSCGYLFRKWVRDFTGYDRQDGPMDMYLMRLPDVWLMYCEAMNELYGPSEELFSLVDRIRHRGALPPLNRAKYGSKETFFEAIEQERIVEFIAEGQRYFDIKRWKRAEYIFHKAEGGYTVYDTWGKRVKDVMKNASDLSYDRYYIWAIPQSEIDKNPNLVQNTPWL